MIPDPDKVTYYVSEGVSALCFLVFCVAVVAICVGLGGRP